MYVDAIHFSVKQMGGNCISHSYISGRVTCLLLPKLVASVKKQPSVSYYKSPADVSVI